MHFGLYLGIVFLRRILECKRVAINILSSAESRDSAAKETGRCPCGTRDDVQRLLSQCRKNWFALIEHEHKRCADILEGYWEVKKEYKNGGQRSEKIYMIVNDMMGEWDTEAWNKIDSYYKKLTTNHKNSDIT